MRASVWNVLLVAALTVLMDGARSFQSCHIPCPPSKRCMVLNGKPACRDGCWPGRCKYRETCVQVQCPANDRRCSDTVYCFGGLRNGRPLVQTPEQVEMPLISTAAPPAIPSTNPNATGISSTPVSLCVGNTSSCGRFQQCIQEGSRQYCADYCDPNRCPHGTQCQLQPADSCAPNAPCPPVASCVA